MIRLDFLNVFKITSCGPGYSQAARADLNVFKKYEGPREEP